MNNFFQRLSCRGIKFPVGNIAALFLRGLTLLSKFLFVLVLARFFSPADVGRYGIFVAAIVYSVYFIGLDFYSYSTRQLDVADSLSMSRVIRNQLALHAGAYAVFLPILFSVFIFDLLPWEFAPWFFVLVFFEHLNEEFTRILTVMQRPVYTTMLLFLRHGLWMASISGLVFYSDFFKDLKVILSVWAFFSAFSLVAAWFKINQLVTFEWLFKLDFKWIKLGVKRSLPFLLGTLSFSFLFTADRYFFQYLSGEDALGAYVLYISLSASVVTFAETGVFSFIYPRLIERRINDDLIGFDLLFKKMVVFSVLFSLALIALLLVFHFSGFLFFLFDNPIYYEYRKVFLVLLGVSFVQVVGLVVHYGLYALSQDSFIIMGNGVGLVSFLLSVYVISGTLGVYTVPVALAFAYFAVFLVKGCALYFFRKHVLN